MVRVVDGRALAHRRGGREVGLLLVEVGRQRAGDGVEGKPGRGRGPVGDVIDRRDTRTRAVYKSRNLLSALGALFHVFHCGTFGI